MFFNTTISLINIIKKANKLRLWENTYDIVYFAKSQNHEFIMDMLKSMLGLTGYNFISINHLEDVHCDFNLHNHDFSLVLCKAEQLENGSIYCHQPLISITENQMEADIDELFNKSHIQVLQEDLLHLTRDSDQNMASLIPYRVIIKDGMLFLREGSLSHILAVIGNLNLVDNDYLQDLITAIYLAKIFNTPIDCIRNAIDDVLMQSMKMEMISQKENLRFFDNSSVISHSECSSIVKYHLSPKCIITGGPQFRMSYELKNTIQTNRIKVILLPETPLDEVSDIEYLLSISIEDSLNQADHALSGEGDILFFPSLNCNKISELSFDFFKEVINR